MPEQIKYPAGYMGLAGELRVMSELLLRNLNPAKSYLDYGADLILESGERIEVKSSHRRVYNKRSYKRKYYSFNLRVGNKNNNKPLNLSGLDFIVCWCIEDDIFYIIPTKSIKNASHISVTAPPGGKSDIYLKFRNAWNLLSGELPLGIPELEPPKLIRYNKMTQGELYD